MAMRRSPQLDPSAELALVERCRSNDAEAFAQIIDRYQGRLFGFVKRMVADPEDAADLTQEAFIRAYQAIGRFDGRSSVRTWLFRIAHNLCIDRARRNERRLAETRLDAAFDDAEELQVSDERWDPERWVIEEELRQVIESAISTMSAKLKSVLLLHDKEDMSYEEISAALEIPVGTVKSRLFLARLHVQKAVSPYIDGGCNLK